MNASPISLALTPALTPRLEGTTVVSVDILRATTAICAAFQAGAEEIVPLDSLQALDAYRPLGYLLAAERGGKKIGDAHYGNSPTEYLRHDLHGQCLAYSTTNGTRCILRGGAADTTLVGAFANISVLTERLLSHPAPLVIICSGWEGNVCVEDTLFAGALIERLLDSGCYTSTNDAARMALDLWHLGKSDPYAFCLPRATHIQRLEGFGAHDDVLFAFRQDTCPVLPRLTQGILKNLH
ncbi:MAG: 2-phosphosulfolactate phosphatase [Bacteroidales bacterium]|nr:2-phosphosulfolactate phosphatase [Bacteroidales bacterium]